MPKKNEESKKKENENNDPNSYAHEAHHDSFVHADEAALLAENRLKLNGYKKFFGPFKSVALWVFALSIFAAFYVGKNVTPQGQVQAEVRRLKGNGMKNVGRSPEDFAEQCCKIMADDDLRLKLSKNAFELVRKSYSIDTLNEILSSENLV